MTTVINREYICDICKKILKPQDTEFEYVPKKIRICRVCKNPTTRYMGGNDE